jgi:CheY-like chemotaxis protein
MPDKNTEKILVVDDQPVNVKLITAYLEKDYEIIPAYSGEEALEKVRTDKPDIVLLDIMMPGISGYEVCERIKQQDTTRFMPVVMITALSELEDKIKGIEAGADDFLTKPINSLELITRVRSLLKSKYFHDQLIRSKEIIEAQNDLKTIMADLLPFLLRDIHPDKKTEVIRQMSQQVEDYLWTKYIQEMPADISQTAGISCSIMNRLGGSFSVETIDDRGFTAKNIKCPWADSNINPVLCMLTKAIFTRIGMRVYDNIQVDIEKTIAGGDGYCLLKLTRSGH